MSYYDYRALIGEPDYSRGINYHRRGRVRKVTLESRDCVIGSVSGSGRKIYNQDILLVWNDTGELIEIDGECSCPIGWNCKHVAAVMLEADAQLSPQDTQKIPQNSHEAPALS